MTNLEIQQAFEATCRCFEVHTTAIATLAENIKNLLARMEILEEKVNLLQRSTNANSKGLTGRDVDPSTRNSV